jgi:two-component system chemotaxis response regulator CheB
MFQSCGDNHLPGLQLHDMPQFGASSALQSDLDYLPGGFSFVLSTRRETFRIESEMVTQAVQKRDIIVIGGSAGALDPLRTLLAHLLGDLPATLFVVIHIPSDFPSLLPEILSRAGPLRAIHPCDGQRIERSMIYVSPPDHHLLVDNGIIRVVHGQRENHHRPAIDPLFRSAARVYGNRVAGVLLSGRLNDGSAGLMAVKMRGGLAVVQEPAEASYPEMPRQAIQHSGADFVLPVEEIAELLKSQMGLDRETISRCS